MYFRVGYWVRILLDPREVDPVEFEYGGPRQIRVTLRHGRADDERQESVSRDATVCLATSQLDPKPSILEMFTNVAAGRLADGRDRETAWRGYLDQFPIGTLPSGSVSIEDLQPEPFKSYIAQVRRELDDFCLRTVRVLRWRERGGGGHNPVLGGLGLLGSFEGTSWWTIPVGVRLRGSDEALVRVPPAVRDEVTELVQRGRTEPLGHELLREASEQVLQNPRSALILAITAAEVGLKEFVGNLVPDARWLVHEAPTPPIIAMIENYLPTLNDRAGATISGSVLPPPRETLDVLKKGVFLRNRVAHVGAAAPSVDTLDQILAAVADLLWLLDYYQGFTWARNYVHFEVGERLWPSSDT
jgi:hypothetical protein